MRFTRTLVLLGAGAALAYFLDPENGARRRQELSSVLEDGLAKRTGSASGPAGSTIVPTPEGVRSSGEA